VHIGGFGLKCEDVAHIMQRSEQIGDNWRDHIPNFRYSREGEFYLFPDDPDLDFEADKLVPRELAKRHARSAHFLVSRIFHRMVFKDGALLYRLARRIYRLLEKWKTLGRVFYFCERQAKRLLFDCQECGDCALFDLAYLCPMSKCAKSQRNGPCGGSTDGMCEADDAKKCVWVMAYDRFSATGKLDYIREEYVPPVECELMKTSSWANYYMGRDHTGKKLAAEHAEQS